MEDARPRPARRGRILIIDDDRLFSTAMERCLSVGHDVVAVNDAEDALHLLESGARFDLIFCDMMMPGMTGMEFFSAVRARFPEHAMRTVFLTGGTFAADARAFLEWVPNPYLEKPFEVQRLTELTREWIGSA
jgi:CheY-like chemotaxis protein